MITWAIADITTICDTDLDHVQTEFELVTSLYFVNYNVYCCLLKNICAIHFLFEYLVSKSGVKYI